MLSHLSWDSGEKPACFRMEQGDVGDDRGGPGRGSSTLEGCRPGEAKLLPHLTRGSAFSQRSQIRGASRIGEDAISYLPGLLYTH